MSIGDPVGFSSDNAAVPTLLTDFIRNPGVDPLATANRINNSLTVVGMNSNGIAFALAGGILTTLPSVNGTTVSETAYGVNGSGLIVGHWRCAYDLESGGECSRDERPGSE